MSNKNFFNKKTYFLLTESLFPFIKEENDELEKWLKKELDLINFNPNIKEIYLAVDGFERDKLLAIKSKTDTIVKHPLTGESLLLENKNETITGEQFQLLFRELKDRAGLDEQKLYLTTWRYLSEAVLMHTALTNTALFASGNAIFLNESAFDRARVISAYGATLNEQNELETSLVLFTLGPVQEFIAAARKTNDLWAGSYLLSWLSWTAMKVFVKELGTDAILFPDLMDQPLVDLWLKQEVFPEALDSNFKEKLKAPTLPNRFFAVVPKEKAVELCKKAEQEVVLELKNLGQFAWDKFEKFFPKPVSEQSWYEQILDFPECYWATLDLPKWKSNEETLEEQFNQQFGNLFIVSNTTSKSKDRITISELLKSNQLEIGLGILYGRFYELLEKVVGGRKALRNFKQIHESGYRCSLIPSQPALIPNVESLRPDEYAKFWKGINEKIAISRELKPYLGKNERLSAVALTKRIFPLYLKTIKVINDISVVSTHTMSVSDFKLQLLSILKSKKDVNEIIEEIKKFVDYSNQLIIDWLDLDYEENQLPKLKKEAALSRIPELHGFLSLPGELFQEEYYDSSYVADLKNENLKKDIALKKLLKKAKNALKGILSKTALKSPSKYYAILYLDGDNMGKWLSGEYGTTYGKAWNLTHFKQNEEVYNTQVLPSALQHISISRALNNYSLYLAKHIVEQKYLGKLIYAGGDDVVAMLSIGDALSCMQDLRAAFSGHLFADDQISSLFSQKSSLNGFVGKPEDNLDKIQNAVLAKENELIDKSKTLLTLGEKATASAGIAVVHYMYPLKQAMADARVAEKFAKNNLGRDAFAVNIVKRSGETYQTGAKWRISANDKEYQLIAGDVLKQFAVAFHEGWLSPKFIVDIENVLDVLVALDQDIIESEINRIFNQHNEGFKEQIKHNSELSLDEKSKLIKQSKNSFFKSTIQVLIKNCDELVSKEEKENMKKTPIKNHKPANWKSLRNAISLMDMAHYLGKGGGR